MYSAINRGRRGVVNVWVIMTLLLLVGLVGLACDAGWSVLVLSKLQSAADSAALAGVAIVKTDQDAARIAARDLAAANLAANTPVHIDLNTGNAAGGDIVIGRWDRNAQTFTVTDSNPNAVKVVANRTATGIDGRVPLIFGPSFGANTVALQRTAIAMTQTTSNAALLVLDPNANCALNIQGSPGLAVSGGAIQVNSGSNTAVCSGGSGGVATISAPELNVVGGTTVITTNAPVNTGSPIIPDPLSGLPAPEDGPTRTSPSNNNNQTIYPGYYPGGIQRTGGTLTLDPGIFVIDNTHDGFSVTGGNLTGLGVMIYMKHGGIDFRGNGIFNLAPPTSGTYANVTVFQARDNFTPSSIRGGNSLTTITGTLYFPNNLVELHGGGASLGNQVIAWQVALGGSSNINVPYNGAFPTGVPKVFLVN